MHAMQGAFVTYLSGIEQALAPRRSFLVGDDLTLADICFVAELCLFHNERARKSVLETAGLLASARRRIRQDLSAIGESFPATPHTSGLRT